MNAMVLNATQISYFAAIGPCSAITLFLVFRARKLRLVITPLLFFLTLTSSFIVPILQLLKYLEPDHARHLGSLVDMLIPAFGFLMIVQFILGRPPSIAYWFVLLVPLIGANGVMLAMEQPEMCFTMERCVPTHQLLTIYGVITSAAIYLFAIRVLQQTPAITKRDSNRRQKYWVIITLIVYNLALLGVDLAWVAERISDSNIAFVKAMIRVTFVYLVLSSVFRVFNESLRIRPISDATVRRDMDIEMRVRTVLREKRLYQEMNFNRTALADELGLTEQHLSRVINQRFGKSFTELMNELRVKDAKVELRETAKNITQIAFDVGFRSSSSFNRVFKSITGQTPREYRSEHLPG